MITYEMLKGSRLRIALENNQFVEISRRGNNHFDIEVYREREVVTRVPVDALITVGSGASYMGRSLAPPPSPVRCVVKGCTLPSCFHTKMSSNGPNRGD